MNTDIKPGEKMRIVLVSFIPTIRDSQLGTSSSNHDAKCSDRSDGAICVGDRNQPREDSFGFMMIPLQRYINKVRSWDFRMEISWRSAFPNR